MMTDLQEYYRDALAELIMHVQDGNLEAVMMMYSSPGKYLADAVGLPHRWVISLALEEI